MWKQIRPPKRRSPSFVLKSFLGDPAFEGPRADTHIQRGLREHRAPVPPRAGGKPPNIGPDSRHHTLLQPSVNCREQH